MDIVFYTFTVLLFAAVILAVEGAYLWWSGSHGAAARRIARRLRIMAGGVDSAGERVSILKQRRYAARPWIDAALHALAPAHAVDRLLIQAGVKWSVAQWCSATVGLLALALLLTQSRGTPLVPACVVCLLAASLPLILLRRARTARLIKIEEQLPEAADFLARAMRAGHSFTNVMNMVGNEMSEPLSGEFRLAHEETNYGVPLSDALHNMADRIPLTDLRYLVIAVVIQRESGGNLAEILGSIGSIIRERLKLIAKVRVLSAEGRMSAWVLGALPFAVAAFMSIVNYQYVSVLWTDPAGVHLLWYGGALILLGAILIRNIVRIRV